MRACPQCLAVFVADPEFCSFDGSRLVSGEDALNGKILEGHRIDQMIGVGGTGCVFRGTRVSDQAACAIKVLFGEMATDRNIAARFEREARAMSAIKHRNVVSIYDFGTTRNGLIYLVMAFLDGVTLKDRIESDAPLTADHASRILEQLTAGLAEAHRQGFVHRDLKPGNVILTGPFGREDVQILDFGIVASIRDASEGERLTKTGYIVGTPTYMAPEQVDPSAVTPQVDVYALGVILYEMLTGAPPFSGTLEQILVAKMTQSPAPIPNGGELGALVLRMLDMEPANRPQSALHVSAELSRLSLLTDDPATVRADMPELAAWGAGASDQGSGVKLVDRTDENDFGEATEEDATDLPDAGDPDEWVAETRRVDVANPDHLDFGDASTHNDPKDRTDTVLDHVVQDDAFDRLPAMSTPTDPDAEAEIDTGETNESDLAEEIPTRITERPEAMRPSAEPETAIDMLNVESDPWLPKIDEAGEDDTALDMRLDHLLAGAAPSIQPAEPAEPIRPPVTVPNGQVLTGDSLVGRTASPDEPHVVVRESNRFLTIGIVLAVLIGIAAAIAIVVTSNETVIVDVPTNIQNQ